jgi:hypothetical protein
MEPRGDNHPDTGFGMKLMLWLLVKGVNVGRWEKPALESD